MTQTTELFGKRSALSFEAPLVAEGAVRSEKTAVEGVGSGADILHTAAAAVELGSLAAGPDLESLCIAVEEMFHQIR